MRKRRLTALLRKKEPRLVKQTKKKKGDNSFKPGLNPIQDFIIWMKEQFSMSVLASYAYGGREYYEKFDRRIPEIHKAVKLIKKDLMRSTDKRYHWCVNNALSRVYSRLNSYYKDIEKGYSCKGEYACELYDGIITRIYEYRSYSLK